LNRIRAKASDCQSNLTDGDGKEQLPKKIVTSAVDFWSRRGELVAGAAAFLEICSKKN
jgi:hypothetical protein